jgi:hypothetical protein
VGRWGVFGHVLLIVRYPSGLFGVLKLALVDCALHVAYVPKATSMPGLCCSYGVSPACTMWCIVFRLTVVPKVHLCGAFMVYVVHLWFELCDCLCMPLCYIYARFYDISTGHYTWFIVTCNELTLLSSLFSAVLAAFFTECE